MTWFRLKGCAKCGGDLMLEELDWLCLQCGTYYYTGLYQRKNGLKQPGSNGPLPHQEKTTAVNGRHAGMCQVRMTALPSFDSLIHQTTGDRVTTCDLNRTSIATNGAEA